MNTTDNYEYKPRSDYDWMIRKYQNSEGLPSKLSGHMAALLDTIPWQLFLTIRGNKGQVRLKQVIQEFRSNCERSFRAPLTMVYSLESIPYWHAHACVASSCNLKNWNFSYCHRVLRDLVGSDPDDYKLEPYDPSRNGLAYVLKSIDRKWDDRSDWDLVNCHFFTDPERQTPHARRHARRRARRHQERLAAAR